MFTTKFVSFKNVLVELLWFIKGSCCLDYLRDNGCKIWDANVKEKGHLGPIYPLQWRRRGVEYIHDDVDSQDGAIDQLGNMIKLIKEDPYSSRILIDNWDVVNLDKMCLSPCHVLFQVFVDKGKLEGNLYLRSSDLLLGLPYNICSYAILLHLLAHITDKKGVKLTVNMGDTHIYSNHFDAVNKQIKRLPQSFPSLWIDPTITNINDFELEHFKIFDYQHKDKLSSPKPMAV